MQPFNFDIHKLERSLSSGIVSFPRGLGRARQQYIRDNNRQLPQPSVDRYHATECVRGIIHG